MTRSKSSFCLCPVPALGTDVQLGVGRPPEREQAVFEWDHVVVAVPGDQCGLADAVGERPIVGAVRGRALSQLPET